MRYFNNLPIADIDNIQFRNVFKRVVLDEIRDDQLINYRLKEYETLPSIAYKIYGSSEFWWVLALLNDIYDINYDIAMPTQQIEFIATELATERKFLHSILYSGAINITPDTEIYEMDLVNPSASDYIVMMTPIAGSAVLNNLSGVNYGYEKTSYNHCKIMVKNHTTIFDMNIVVFKKPDFEESLITEKFVECFDKLLREADVKRMIRLIKQQDLGYFLTQFINALKSETDGTGARTFIKSTNSLKEYLDYDIPDHGLVVDIDTNYLEGAGKYTTLKIPEYDYDYHIYVSPTPLFEQLDSIGTCGVRSFLSQPRIYNTGSDNISFDYLILSPDDKEHSLYGEVLQSGIARFSGSGDSSIISLHDHAGLNDKNIGLIITPIVDKLSNFNDIGKYSFLIENKNTIHVYNTGGYGNRFFWSIVRNMIDLETYQFSGFTSGTVVSNGTVVDDLDKVNLFVTPALFQNWVDAGNVGAVGFYTVDSENSEIKNTGNAGDIFNYKVIIDDEITETTTNPVLGRGIEIPDHPSRIFPGDVCLLMNIKSDNIDDIASVGALAIEFVDKNYVKIRNSGEAGIPIRYSIIDNPLAHGEEYSAGYNNYISIHLDEIPAGIIDQSQYALFVYPIFMDPEYNPIFNNEEFITTNFGEIYYVAHSLTELRVYNTGLPNMPFKWILMERQ